MGDRELRNLAEAFAEALPPATRAHLAAVNAQGHGLFLGAAARSGDPGVLPAGEWPLAQLRDPTGGVWTCTTRRVCGPGARVDLQRATEFRLPSPAAGCDPASARLFEELVNLLTMQLPFRLPGRD